MKIQLYSSLISKSLKLYRTVGYTGGLSQVSHHNLRRVPSQCSKPWGNNENSTLLFKLFFFFFKYTIYFLAVRIKNIVIYLAFR